MLLSVIENYRILNSTTFVTKIKFYSFFSEKIDLLATDEKLRQEMGEAGREKVRQQFALNKINTNINSTYYLIKIQYNTKYKFNLIQN